MPGIFHWDGADSSEVEKPVAATQHYFKAETELDLSTLFSASSSSGLGFVLLIEYVIKGADFLSSLTLGLPGLPCWGHGFPFTRGLTKF